MVICPCVVRILWSPSPHATAELFDELKQGRDQPDPAQAATLGVDIIDDFNLDKYNPQVFEIRKKTWRKLSDQNV